MLQQPPRFAVALALSPMQDALLTRSLRYVVLAVISAISLSSLILSYTGIFDLVGADYHAAGMRLGWGFGAGIAALLLIRFRGDLIDI